MKKIIYWLPSLIWMFIVFGFSAQPSLHISAVNWQDFIIRKSAHFIEYLILFYLYYFALRKTTRLSPQKARNLALFTAVIYACTDEIHQLFVAGREGRIRDVIIDSLGASLGWLIWRLW